MNCLRCRETKATLCVVCNHELTLDVENQNKRLRQRIEMILKCLDGGLNEGEKYNQQQLLIKAIAKGEREGGGE